LYINNKILIHKHFFNYT